MTARRLAAAAVALVLLGGSVAVAGEPVPSGAPGKQGGDPAPDAQAAVALIARGRYEDAVLSARRSLQRNEKYVPALLAMAKAYYYLKKYEFSGSIIAIAQKIEPNNAEAAHLLGHLALVREDRMTAIAHFRKAVEARPDYGNAWNNLAAMYLHVKNYQAAYEAAQKATQLLPTFDKAWLNLGSALRGKSEYPAAEAAFNKARELNSRYPAAYFNLGIMYLDAPQIPNVDTTARLNQAIAHLSRYKDYSTLRPPIPNDPVDAYIEEANKAIVLEGKRLERERKKKEREKAKAAPAEPADGAPKTPAAPAPGGAGGDSDVPSPGGNP